MMVIFADSYFHLNAFTSVPSYIQSFIDCYCLQRHYYYSYYFDLAQDKVVNYKMYRLIQLIQSHKKMFLSCPTAMILCSLVISIVLTPTYS